MSHRPQSDAPTQSCVQPEAMHEELVKAIPKLRAFAIALTGSVQLADDLVQDTLLKAWSHRQSFTQGTNFRAWLFTILRNTFFSDCRSRMRQRHLNNEVAPGNVAQPAEQHGHLDMTDFLTALSRLPSEQREALMLVGAEGFSYGEAARIAGTEIGTIKSRVHRARVRLSEALEITSATDFGADACTGGTVSRPDYKRA